MPQMEIKIEINSLQKCFTCTPSWKNGCGNSNKKKWSIKLKKIMISGYKIK